MAARVRILFVDDDPDILGALRRILRKDRVRWDMVFANGGREALGELRRGTCHVIVSDLRMPEMDGAALLAAVSVESPQTIRIVLSGFADSELMDRATPLAHVMLSKPCEHGSLRAAIARMLSEAAG